MRSMAGRPAAQYQAKVALEGIVAVSHEELVAQTQSALILLLPVLICPDRLVRNIMQD